MRILTQRLRKAMSERGVERADLSLAIGSSQSVINSWYSGERTPNAGSIVEICRALDISADYLLGLKESMR